MQRRFYRDGIDRKAGMRLRSKTCAEVGAQALPGIPGDIPAPRQRLITALLEHYPQQITVQRQCYPTEKGSTRPGAGAPHPTAGSAASPRGGQRSNGRNRQIDETLTDQPLTPPNLQGDVQGVTLRLWEMPERV